jgi:hypothetical protein
MLFVTWVADPFRPTRDLDLLGFGDNGVEAIAETFRVICAQSVADDGVTFDVAALEVAPIRDDVEYGGVRVRTRAAIAGARIADHGRSEHRKMNSRLRPFRSMRQPAILPSPSKNSGSR